MKGSEIERYMQMAVEEAEKGMRKMDGGPFGAVIVRDGEVLAAAHNEVVGSNDPTAHAEIVAIRKACSRLGSFNLEGSILFATGEPCPMCFSAIHWAHIERVYYCNSKDDAAEYFCVFVDVIIGDFNAVSKMLFSDTFDRNRALWYPRKFVLIVT